MKLLCSLLLCLGAVLPIIGQESAEIEGSAQPLVSVPNPVVAKARELFILPEYVPPIPKDYLEPPAVDAARKRRSALPDHEPGHLGHSSIAALLTPPKPSDFFPAILQISPPKPMNENQTHEDHSVLQPSSPTAQTLEAGSVPDHEHHTHEEPSGDVKSRKKRTYCSRCGGQLGGGYGGGYGGGGYGGGGCGSGCGGGRPIYQQRPVYQQPIYQQPIYQQRPQVCSVCGQPYGGGGGGYGGYGGGSQSYSSSQSSSSSSAYGKK